MVAAALLKEWAQIDKRYVVNQIIATMKKSLLFLLTSLLTLFSTVSYAQETLSITEVYTQSDSGKPLRWSGLVTNRFWDNWEISAGFGSSALDINSIGGSLEPGNFWKRNSWNANIAVTKWLNPIVGARLQFDIGQYQNYSNASSVYGNDIYQTPYLFAHGDFMINLSNWIGGYKERRVYSAVPYVGFGYTLMSWTSGSVGQRNDEFAFTAGTLNKFRVSRQFDIQLDLRSWFFPTRDLPEQIRQGSDSSVAMAFSASVGLAYRFNKRGWDRAFTPADVSGYIALVEELNADLLAAAVLYEDAQKHLTQLKSENGTLCADLDECRKAPRTIKEEVVATDGVLFFNIGTASLTPYAQATLDTYIAAIKGSNSPLTITGYADKETGSAARNEQLSRERAESVKAYMVDRGIAQSRITTSWVGDTVQLFSGKDAALTNRCVVIK